LKVKLPWQNSQLQVFYQIQLSISQVSDALSQMDPSVLTTFKLIRLTFIMARKLKNKNWIHANKESPIK
jgi:hypothetical protein